jgi:hypothetical protein
MKTFAREPLLDRPIRFGGWGGCARDTLAALRAAAGTPTHDATKEET